METTVEILKTLIWIPLGLGTGLLIIKVLPYAINAINFSVEGFRTMKIIIKNDKTNCGNCLTYLVYRPKETGKKEYDLTLNISQATKFESVSEAMIAYHKAEAQFADLYDHLNMKLIGVKRRFGIAGKWIEVARLNVWSKAKWLEAYNVKQ